MSIDTRTGEITDALSDDEYADLERLETVVSKGLATFVEVGSALAEIRDRRLYRDTHPTFALYCEQQWEMGKSQAYRLIDAAEVVAEMSPIGDEPIPATESQARALKTVAPDQRADVMREASEDGPATAAKIKDVVEKRTETPAKGREVREERVTTEPAPERDQRAARAADAADRLAQQLTAYVPAMVDEKTIRRVEVWCERWRNQ